MTTEDPFDALEHIRARYPDVVPDLVGFEYMVSAQNLPLLILKLHVLPPAPGKLEGRASPDDGPEYDYKIVGKPNRRSE